MERPFRIGIVGTGMITAGSHLPQTLASPMAEVVALVDPVEERARRLATSYGLDVILATDLEPLFGKIDGAIIATPNHTHCDLAVRCLDAGIAVLVEKPLATTVAEGERIAAAARRAGVTVAVGYATRYYENVQRMGALLAEGYFGAIRRFYYQFGTPGGWAPLSSYNLSREKVGGGVFVVTGTHFLDRMLAWFGAPTDVEFWDDARGGPEANCLARFHYDRDGVEFHGEARFSKTTALKAGFVLDTEKGVVVFPEGPDSPILLRPAGHPGVELVVRGPRVLPVLPPKDAFQLQVEDFIRSARSGEKPLISAEEGVASLRLIEQLYRCRNSTETPENRTVLEVPHR